MDFYGQAWTSDTRLRFKNAISNGRYRTRTCDPLIKSQLTELRNFLRNSILIETRENDCTQICAQDLALCLAHVIQAYPDLVKLVQLWPTLGAAERQGLLDTATEASADTLAGRRTRYVPDHRGRDGASGGSDNGHNGFQFVSGQGHNDRLSRR